MTKVSVLSNLRISGCELRDNYYVSFTQLLENFFLPLYRHFSDCKSHFGFSIAGAVTHFSQFEKGIFCP